MTFFISDGYQKKAQDSGDKRLNFDYWSEIICDEFVMLDCEKGTDINDSAFTAELRGGKALSSLRFAEVQSAPHIAKRSKSQIGKSTEADFLISFQIANQGIVRQNGREAILTPRTFAMYDSTQPYTLSFKENFHQLIVQMPKKVLSQHLMNPEQYTAVQMSGHSGLGAVLTNFIFSLAKEMGNINQQSDELSDNLINMIAMAFSSSVMLEQVGSNSVVKESLKTRIYRYIELNLCNPELSNQSIADSQGISVRYLNKLFEDQSESVHSLILEKRLQRSYNLLQDSAYQGHSIEMIAFNSGFSSAAHFSRCFKKRFGTSPGQLR
ncbi:helix-turn-helix domain-containing protein [Alteromonadaceae bacterium M269]|nr:helix-turn-helix domain-containing protein [Alteromonadaceae bacterium M269]